MKSTSFCIGFSFRFNQFLNLVYKICFYVSFKASCKMIDDTLYLV